MLEGGSSLLWKFKPLAVYVHVYLRHSHGQ